MGGLRGDAAQDVEAVRAAVEGDAGFVEAGFRGQVGEVCGGDVGDVGDEDVDMSAQGGWQGSYRSPWWTGMS